MDFSSFSIRSFILLLSPFLSVAPILAIHWALDMSGTGALLLTLPHLTSVDPPQPCLYL